MERSPRRIVSQELTSVSGLFTTSIIKAMKGKKEDSKPLESRKPSDCVSCHFCDAQTKKRSSA
jgi:hypothetical protein